jgi:hypothetical protein
MKQGWFQPSAYVDVKVVVIRKVAKNLSGWNAFRETRNVGDVLGQTEKRKHKRKNKEKIRDTTGLIKFEGWNP